MQEYIGKHFSILSKVLFQTQFSSLLTGTTIVAMSLENSEVAKDVSALQWQDGASNGLVISPSDEMHNSKVSMGGLADAPAAEFAAATKCLQLSDISPVFTDPNYGTTDFIDSLVDDCYYPDTSMIETQNIVPSFCQDPTGSSIYIPIEMCLLHPQEEAYHMSPSAFGHKKELVTQPSMSSLFCEEQLSQSSTTTSLSKAVPEHEGEIVESCSSLNYAGMASAEVYDVRFEHDSDDVFKKNVPVTYDTGLPRQTKPSFKMWGVLSIPHHSLCKTTNACFMLEAETMRILDHEEVSQVREQSLHSSDPTSSMEEEPAQPYSPLSQFDHTLFSKSGDESDRDDILAVEALQLNLLHNFLSGDELSSIEVPHATASEESLPLVAEIVSGSVGVEEEDPSGESCHKQGRLQIVEQDSSITVMPSPQDVPPLSVMSGLLQTITGGASSLSFLDLLAHVSAAHSGSFKHEQCLIHHTGATSCAKRPFMEDEAESPAEKDMVVARSP